MNDEHSEVPTLSASIAKILCAETPLHAWTAHPKLNPNYTREEKEIFDLGTVAHALMLQGLEFGEVLDFPDWRTDKAQSARSAARKAGKTPILKKHWERIVTMVLAGIAQLEHCKEAPGLFSPKTGDAEQTLIWEDDHGVVCKARLDWLLKNRLIIADYKTTGTTANPEALAKYATSTGWDVQAAFYLRGLKKLTGVDADFLFVVQEDYMPHALSVAGLTEETLITGEKKVQFAIDTFYQCLTSGKWPGYPLTIGAVPFDMWDAERWAAKEIRA